MTLLVRDCTVLTLDGDFRVLPHHDVLIDGDRIAAIVPTGTALAAARVLDARGLYLLPGLVNTHTHVGAAFFRGTTGAMELFRWLEYGWFYIRRMSAEDVYWSALHACLEMIKAGVTTFCDMYFDEHEVARAVEGSGLRACLSEAIMEPAPRMEARAPVEAQIERAVDLHRRWDGASNGRIRIFLGPHSLYLCSRPTIERLLAVARSPVHIHLAETRREMDEARQQWGRTPPERLADLGVLERHLVAAHCVHLTASDIELLDRPTVGVAHSPASNLKLQSGRAPVEALVGRRLAVGLGSDGCGSNDVIDILKDAYLAAILHPWREEQRAAHTALAMATRDGARALGMEREAGTIEVGRKADVILVSLDEARTTPVHDPHLALVYTARGGDVVTTIVDGRVLMENRRVLTLDETEILAQARERAARIFAECHPAWPDAARRVRL